MDDLKSINIATHHQRLAAGQELYTTLDIGTKAILWESKQQEHLLMQPHIPQQIINTVKANPMISWKGLEGEINHWCSDGTIRRWLTSWVGYKLYTDRVIPLLSDAQRAKHFAFAKRFRNNWVLGNGKYLLIYYDEKWF
jgi:hypothetical protein